MNLVYHTVVFLVKNSIVNFFKNHIICWFYDLLSLHSLSSVKYLLQNNLFFIRRLGEKYLFTNKYHTKIILNWKKISITWFRITHVENAAWKVELSRKYHQQLRYQPEIPNILINELNMYHVCKHIVPKVLSADQKETSMILAGVLITMADQN